jgi:hypothetical protein
MPPVPQSPEFAPFTPQVHCPEHTASPPTVQSVPSFVPCTHTGGVTSPGGFVPQPLEAVVKDNSDGSAKQQSQVDVAQGFGEQVPGPTSTPFCAAHCVALVRPQVLKAPIGADCTQHWLQSWKQQAEPGVATVPPIAVQSDGLLTVVHWFGGIWQVTPLVPHAVAAKQAFSSLWHVCEIDVSRLTAQLWNLPLHPELAQGQFDRTALRTLQRCDLHAAVRPPKSPARADAPDQMASKEGSRIAGSRK